MTTERQLPGSGYVNETGTRQAQIPGGAFVNETVSTGATGTVNVTNATDTSAASGTTTVIGTLTKPNADDTCVASGIVGAGSTGTVAYANVSDSVSAAGTTTVIGSVSNANTNDTLAASGTTTIIGILARTNADDSCAASGFVGPPIAGTVAYSNINDSIAASGTTTIIGTASNTNNNDTVVASGSVTTTAIIARPISDTATGGWLPNTGSSLYATVDEVTADDADYIYATSATTCKMALNPVVDPLASSGQVVSYRAWATAGNGLTVNLKQGAATIATWTHTTLPTSASTFQQILSAAECDAITDYAALSIEMTSI